MKTKEKSNFFDKEITLIDIIEFLNIFKPVYKKNIFIIIFFIALSTILGYIAKVTSPEEYISKCVLYNESGDANSNTSIQALALLTGANSGNSLADASGGDLYQLILSNKPFLIELSKTPVYTHNPKKTITLASYFDKEPELDAIEDFLNSVKSIPQKVNALFFNNSKNSVSNTLNYADTSIPRLLNGGFTNKIYISELSAKDKKIISILSSRIKFSQSGKLSTLNVKMPEAKLSAEVNKLVLELLIKYAVQFKVGKQLENVEFLEKRASEAEFKYKNSQQKVAQFKDNNYNLVFQSAQTTQDRLQNDFQLFSGIYNQLATQLEQAKIQLKKDSPLFTIVEPVYIPDQVAVDNSKVLSYLFKGALIGMMLALLNFYKCYRIHKKNNY